MKLNTEVSERLQRAVQEDAQDKNNSSYWQSEWREMSGGEENKQIWETGEQKDHRESTGANPLEADICMPMLSKRHKHIVPVQMKNKNRNSNEKAA